MVPNVPRCVETGVICWKMNVVNARDHELEVREQGEWCPAEGGFWIAVVLSAWSLRNTTLWGCPSPQLSQEHKNCLYVLIVSFVDGIEEALGPLESAHLIADSQVTGAGTCRSG